MTERELLIRILESLYSKINESKKTVYIIRNWCLTLVFALITAILSEKFKINFDYGFYLILTLIFLFWFLESIHQTFIKFDQHKAIEIEKLLSEKKEFEHLDQKLFIISGRVTIPYIQKIKTFLKSMFLTEYLISFYILIFIAVILAFRFIDKIC